MTVFWVVTAFLVAAALLFVVPPIFRRDEGEELERREVNITIYKNQLAELEEDFAAGDITQEHYDKSRQEIERRLLEDASVAEKGKAKSGGKGLAMGTAAAVAVAIPVIAYTMYMDLGNQDALDPNKHMQQSMVSGDSPHGDQTNMAAQIEMMVANLAQRLQENPQDIEGWVMLARSFSVLGRYQEAVQAYEKAIQFVGDDPNILTDYADAIAMSSGESLEGKPLQLLQKAVSLDPNNQKALWLIGTALFERGDFTGAIEHWEHLLNILPAGSDDAGAMRGNIAEARNYLERQRKGEFGAAPPVTSLDDTLSGSGSAKIDHAPAKVAKVSGTITIDEKLAGKVDAGDTLFVFAKAVRGPPMPLAIIKGSAKELPIEFTLDETMAMMPAMSLAKFNEVVIGARVSKGGNAIAQSGDLEGYVAKPVTVGSEGVEVRIDTVVP